MFGIVIAFKNYKFNLGIWGSDWIGFKNFEYLFKSDTFLTLLRNTLGYNIAGMALSRVIPIIVALLMERIHNKYALKVFQSGMFIPYFLSWIVVSYFTFALFSYDTGMINNLLVKFGAERISFYTDTAPWPFILIILAQWKTLGYNALIYYGCLLGIDPTLYEAATIDGCNYLRKLWHVTLPQLVQPIIILLLLSLGGMFRSDYSLYYFIPNDTGALYKVTDVIDTYIFRTLRSASNLGISSAMAFLQSIVGFVLVVFGNSMARKYDENTALF